ncbi:hypothetical protein [Actinoallomurus iriomotensis]|uniref:Uncharacterized protein n=1 Tax=Actinoallomurus iriomotensis TaxID=478107 RepID=A0A9W6VV60_9ACTN|nr:hypothetical protein [Actinoallomurus iriomotensis]GLY79401.1 hypothetical protein Airi01_076680 [Actinoallomurus iriomotensis]
MTAMGEAPTVDVNLRRRQALDAIRDALIRDLNRYMPASGYRDFYGWALTTENPDRDGFCRIIALNQLAVMTTAMLDGLGEAADWPILLRHAVPVNLYQVFEVVSDNLGLGLARVRRGAPSAQRDLLIDFNDTMIADLRTPSATPAAELLARLRTPAAVFSGSAQSLAPDSHTAATRHYAEAHGEVTLDELDHAVWLGLVANVESGRDVLAAIRGTCTEPLVRDTTIDRYQAVNRILQSRHLSRLERAVLGAQTILVVPTLGYFTAVLGEVVGTDMGYRRAVEDGSLLEAMSNAALLVRLQNDLGTRLLRMTREQQRAFLRELPERHPPADGEDVLAVLTRASDAEPVLNRFRKDLKHGEFNVCLSELNPQDDVHDGLAVLSDSLAYFTALYTRHRRALVGDLAQLETRLRDQRITALIKRFVLFHEKMYALHYDGGSGDYAV